MRRSLVFLKVLTKVDELDEELQELDIQSWDTDQLKQEIISGVLEECINDVSNEVESFSSELNEYMDELSESRREKIEERYCDLDEVTEILSDRDYDDLDDVFDRIDDAERMLEEMLK